MHFDLNDDLPMLREIARDLAEKENTPFADKWDEGHYLH